jgi:hypothetical protein
MQRGAARTRRAAAAAGAGAAAWALVLALAVGGVGTGGGAPARAGAKGAAAAADTAAARDAYLTAVAKKYGASADEKAARAGLEDVAKKWPATLYGKRAKEELDAGVSPMPTPFLAPPVAWFALFLLPMRMGSYMDSGPGPVPGPGPGPGPVTPPTKEMKEMAAKARSYLDKVKEESLRYFGETHTLKDGTPMPHEFPPSSMGATPAAIYCGKAGAAPVDKLFKDHETWSVLKFVPDVKLPFQYEYRADGQDEYAFFEFTIRGDMDCDGYTSTFTIRGRTEGTMTPAITGPEVFDEFE